MSFPNFPTELRTAIQVVAEQHALPPQIVGAIVWVESRGEPTATRYEPAFDRRYNLAPGEKPAPGLSVDEEERGRATSWGLMQVMGETARFLGFGGPFERLCVPGIGLEWGSRYLAWLCERNPGATWEEICRAYNGGEGGMYKLTNPYPSRVLAACGGVWPERS